MKINKIYLENIWSSIKLIEEYMSGKNFWSFKNSRLTIDAVSKRLEDIGENMKKIP
jgi:uncharacterized protein with HEPN domain